MIMWCSRSSVAWCQALNSQRFFAGLWLNIPDYDAPTQMVKPKERNTRYVNAVMTIPKVDHFNVRDPRLSGGK